MLRVSVQQRGHEPLPALDVAEARFVIGSGPDARVRLPAAVARAEHVVIDGGRWTMDGETGDIGAGVELAIGAYVARIAPAPTGTQASPPQRTESLARELMRGLLGGDGAPTVEVERGPVAGVKRTLPPPVATLVIGRGEDADWIILDEDLSRGHAELRRGWDGVSIRDLGSRNGTRVDGEVLRGEHVLRDGQAIELGKVVLRYRDPAERHLQGPVATMPGRAVAVRAAAEVVAAPAPGASRWPFALAVAIGAAALAGIAWILAG